MSYTVLARKWRPKKFAELVGQQHVMQALANALDQNRLHHAYLFTGTRGVGKTTIARIFAKALNCEQGVSSTPCGVCDNCRAIDEGKFIDLIEVDAASKTKVDDTREILDNVQFAATQGRFKVYLIDEVHMLSKSSFNALLKTLEEPPEHVKFILATTDPHKLPITVLSRCLQFNLMRLTVEQIQSHLAYVLSQESLSFDESALGLIAKSADGSARDALSLLDQAIAYGGGSIKFEAVQTMLGLVDQQFTIRIFQALANTASEDLKAVIMDIGAMGVDYQALLTQMIEALHAISYHQVFQDVKLNSGLPDETLQGFAESLSAERVQMLYQIALLTKQDMLLSPDIRIGFEMGLMRMLAFIPQVGCDVQKSQGSQIAAGKPLSVSEHSTPSASQSSSQSLNSGPQGIQQAQSQVSQMPQEISREMHRSTDQATANPVNEANAVSDSGLSSDIRPNESPMMQDMEINDAMTHLSSARSLVSGVAKKKDELGETSETSKTAVEEIAQPQPVNHSQMLQARLQALQTSTASANENLQNSANTEEPQNTNLSALTNTAKQSQITDSPEASNNDLDGTQNNTQLLSQEPPTVAVDSAKPEKVDLPWEGESQFAPKVAEDSHLELVDDQTLQTPVGEMESDLALSNDIVESQMPSDSNPEAIRHEKLSENERLDTESQSRQQFYDVPWADDSDHVVNSEEINRPVSFDGSERHSQEPQAEALTDIISSKVDNGLNQTETLNNQNADSEVLAIWMQWIEDLKFSGMQREVALNSVLLPAGENFNLALMPEHDYPHVHSLKQEMAQILSQHCQKVVEWQAWPNAEGNSLETPGQFLERQAQKKLENAKQSLMSDSVFQQLVGKLDMQVLENTFSVKE